MESLRSEEYVKRYPKVAVIMTQDSNLIPPTTFSVFRDEAEKLLRTLTIKNIKVWHYPYKTVLRVEYDSMLMGAAFTFIEGN